MSFDKTLPDGDVSIAQGDDVIRDNNLALETAIHKEHTFATGGTQSGRHAFDIDTDTNRDGDPIAFEDGGIFFSNDARSGNLVLQIRDSGTWESADLEPLDGGDTGSPTLPRVNSKSKFTVSQFASWVQVIPVNSSPDTLAIDLNTSPFKRATIVDDTFIQAPINTIANYGTIVTLDLTMDGSGPYTITWATIYRAASSSIAIDNQASGRTLVTMIMNYEGNWVLSSRTSWNSGTVVSN